MSKQANQNRNALADIRRRMQGGKITVEQAKVEAAPIIASMNEKAKSISKQYGMRHKPLTFAYLMR